MAQFTRPFGKWIRHGVAPSLRKAGFVFDDSRTFRRFVPDTQSVHIINFQLGVRSLAGKFTVNLGVYRPDHCVSREAPEKVTTSHCLYEQRQRLGFLNQPRHEMLERIPFIGVIFKPKDRWWPVEDPQAREEAKQILLSQGLAWLEKKTPGGIGR